MPTVLHSAWACMQIAQGGPPVLPALGKVQGARHGLRTGRVHGSSSLRPEQCTTEARPNSRHVSGLRVRPGSGWASLLVAVQAWGRACPESSGPVTAACRWSRSRAVLGLPPAGVAYLLLALESERIIERVGMAPATDLSNSVAIALYLTAVQQSYAAPRWPCKSLHNQPKVLPLPHVLLPQRLPSCVMCRSGARNSAR